MAADSDFSIYQIAGGSRWDRPMRDSSRDPRTVMAISAEPRVETVEVEEDDRRRIERQRLADDQAADDGVAERLPDLGSCAGAEHQRNPAEERRHRRHHDRPETQQTGFANGVPRRETAIALRLDREIDQHDAVL